MEVIKRLRSYDKRLAMDIANEPKGFLTRIIEESRLKVSQFQSEYSQDRQTVRKIDNGALELGRIGSENQIDSIKEEIEGLLAEDRYAEVQEVEGSISYKAVTSNRVNLASLDDISQLPEDERVKEEARKYMGSEFSVRRILALKYNHVAGPVNQESGTSTRKWHLDTLPGGNLMRLIVFLEDSSPLQVVPEEETYELLEDHTIEELEENPDMVVEEADVEEYGGEKGGALMFNPSTQLHRAANPEKGDTRTVLIYSIYPDDIVSWP